MWKHKSSFVEDFGHHKEINQENSVTLKRFIWCRKFVLNRKYIWQGIRPILDMILCKEFVIYRYIIWSWIGLHIDKIMARRIRMYIYIYYIYDKKNLHANIYVILSIEFVIYRYILYWALNSKYIYIILGKVNFGNTINKHSVEFG